MYLLGLLVLWVGMEVLWEATTGLLAFLCSKTRLKGHWLQGQSRIFSPVKVSAWKWHSDFAYIPWVDSKTIGCC